MSKRTRNLIIGIVAVFVLLPPVLFVLGLAVFFKAGSDWGRVKVGMTQAQVRSELHLYRERTVDVNAISRFRSWFTADPRTNQYRDYTGDVKNLDIRSYGFLGMRGGIFVAYDKRGRVAAVQEYD